MKVMETLSSRSLQAPKALTTSRPAQDGFLQRLCATLFAPVDISFLVFLRIVFGAIMLWEVYRYFTHGWIARYYIDSTVYFTYYGFSWVKPWPGRGMYVHFFVLGILAACILIGFCYRIAATLFFLGFTYVFLLDQTRYLNHFYLICLLSFLLIFVPAERAVSVDTLLRPKLRSEVAPAWTLWLLRAQIGFAYFFGGIAKLSSDWLRGEPMRSWLTPLIKVPLIGSAFKHEWVIYNFVIGGLLLDLFIVPLLLWRRTRVYAFLASVAFHVVNALLFQIGIFPWFMLFATLIFFPPDLMRRLAVGFWSPESASARIVTPAKVLPENCGLSPKQKAVVLLLALYFVVQIILPLRHFVYPGDVNWTEEGHNFSWHMKLRAKKAEALFTIIDPANGQTWTVDPRQYLETRQLEKMATHPDMILQFSHYLAERKRREGHANVEVRARVMASLNGRKPQLLVDPTIDLAREEVSLLPARWIVPLTEPLVIGTSALQEIEDETEN